MTAPPIQPKRVLVVDDERFVADALKMMLMNDGFMVEIANNGDDALKLFNAGKFDLVVTDYSMTGMKGDELATAIKARSPTVPVILVTAYAELLESSGALLAGIDCVISKPFMMDKLREAIKKVFAEQRVGGMKQEPPEASGIKNH